MRPIMTLLRTLAAALALGLLAPVLPAAAQPLRIVIDEGVIEPLPFAVPDFIAENGGAEEYARDITGAVQASGDRIVVKFRLFDVYSGQQMGEGLQFAGTPQSWRRMAHKVADAAYSRITGEGGYFDSRVVFVAESGPKNQRQKRLGVMDYDGANVQYLTDSSSIVLAPRFSPTGDRILFTSYTSGFPAIYLMDV